MLPTQATLREHRWTISTPENFVIFRNYRSGPENPGDWEKGTRPLFHPSLAGVDVVDHVSTGLATRTRGCLMAAEDYGVRTEKPPTFSSLIAERLKKGGGFFGAENLLARWSPPAILEVQVC